MVRTRKGSQDGKSETREYSYAALKFEQHGKAAPSLVIFHAPVGEVLSWAEVGELETTRKSAKKTGAQREQKKAKVRAIKKFLAADRRNIIPTAVIVAFSEGTAEFDEGVREGGTLTITAGATYAANIVDGQHRLYGMKEFSPDTQAALVGLLDADHVEKAFQFLVINNKSSRVAATHTKALLSRMHRTELSKRLGLAKMSFEVEGIKDVDLVNTDAESPFYQTIDWTTTPKDKRMVQATAIEMSLDYIGGLGISEYDDHDVRRSVFLTMWKTVKQHWKPLWKRRSRLVSKVGIVCLTKFVMDMIVKWSENDELEIELTDLEDIVIQTKKIISLMDVKFWTAEWAEGSQGGFDTNQGRERVVRALSQLHRNGRQKEEWYTDIDIISRTSVDDESEEEE